MTLKIALLFLIPTLSVIAVTGNILVVIGICKARKNRRTPSNIFTAFLSSVDIICVTATLLKYAIQNLQSQTSHLTCALFFTICCTACIVNLGILCVFTIDRFTTLSFPFKYRVWMTKRKAVKIGAATSMVCLLLHAIFMVYMIDWTTEAVCNISLIVTPALTVTLAVMTGCVCLALLVMYSLMFRTARNFHRRRDAYHVDNQIKPRLADLKALRTCAVIAGTFLVMWIPRLMFFNLVAFYPDSDLFRNLMKFNPIFPVCNAVLEPLVYAILNKDIRTAVMSLFMSRDTSEDPSVRISNIELRPHGSIPNIVAD